MRWVGFRDRDAMAIRAVPRRDAMSPPKLPADAPIADILQPIVVHLGQPFRDDRDAT